MKVKEGNVSTEQGGLEKREGRDVWEEEEKVRERTE